MLIIFKLGKSYQLNQCFKRIGKLNRPSLYLTINYTTAKNIFFRYKKNIIQKKSFNLPESKRHQQKLIGLSKSLVKVVCSKGGLLNCYLKSKDP